MYYYLVGLAGKTGQLDTVFKDMPSTREMFRTCEPSLTTEQLQKLYRLLHEVLLAAGRSEAAGQVMVELLGTFTMENASQAREEAQRCILASLALVSTTVSPATSTAQTGASGCCRSSRGRGSQVRSPPSPTTGCQHWRGCGAQMSGGRG